jgi:K319L-like, PKD domain
MDRTAPVVTNSTLEASMKTRKSVTDRIVLYFLMLLAFPSLAVAQQPLSANTGGNNPPRAVIGPSQKIGVHPNVSAMPTLDGSQSYDPDGDRITYQWKDSRGFVIGTGKTVPLTISVPGTYIYTLTVTDTHADPQGNPAHFSGSASTVVEVVLDVVPPLVDAPDITVSVTDPGSATVSKSTPLSNYILSGATTSAVDDVDSHPRFLGVAANDATVDGDTVFPEGDTPLNVFYTDQAGNVGSSPSTVHVVDRQDDDIFILTGEGNCFNSPCNDVVQRVRGSVVEDFCQLAGGSSPGRGILLDSSGRVVALRDAFNIAGSAGVELVRCSAKGAPPEKFAFIRYAGPFPAGYPEPFPGQQASDGGGLTLARLRDVVIDDHQNSGRPFVVNEDAYIFNFQVPHGAQLPTNKSVMYHVTQDYWEDGPDLGSLASWFGGPASLAFNSGATYVSGASTGCLGRVKVPLSIHATGEAGGVDFDLRLNLFGSSGEFCGLVLNDVTAPDMALCPGDPPPNPAPTDGNAFSVMTGFQQVLFDDLHGNGLTLISNSGAAGNGILTNFSLEPIDAPSSPDNFFANPFIGCALTEEVRYAALYHGFYLGGPIGVASRGLVAMFSGPGLGNSSLDEVTSSGQVVPIVPTGLGPVGYVTAWPPNVSAGSSVSVLIRMDSPVDVLVTGPNGKKLGMENGVPVNDFGSDGSDTGPDSDPRFYAINKPVPGDYRVQSVGTGSGPYTVHVYSVDTSKPFGQHIFRSGNTEPGALSSENFTMDADGGLAFTNHLPIANAGPDQIVNAAANGMAAVDLDGSASSDPDSDPLTFVWAGPFGLVTGSQAQVTLPVGDSVLQLTVDDGKGGSASANVTVAVRATGDTGDTVPPIVTPPAAITIPATEASGARASSSAALAAFLAAGSAVDSVDPSPARLTPQVGGVDVNASTLFPIGTTTTTFEFRDASGNVGSAASTVTVLLGVPSIAVAIVNKGVDPSGARFFDLQFTSNGSGNVRGVALASLRLRTLSGTGTVTMDTSLSPALPIDIGDLDVGAKSTVRIFLNVPSTVSRLSIVESMTLRNVVGTVFKASAGQATSLTPIP